MNEPVRKRQEVLTRIERDQASVGREITSIIRQINDICDRSKSIPITISAELMHGSCDYVKNKVRETIDAGGWVVTSPTTENPNYELS